MRLTGRTVHARLLFSIVLLCPVSLLAQNSPQPGRLPNALTNNAIVASPLSLAHDRSRAATAFENSKAIEQLRKILNNSTAIKIFISELLQSDRSEKKQLIAALVPYLQQNQQVRAKLESLVVAPRTLNFDTDIAPLLQRATDEVKRVLGVEWNYRHIYAKPLNSQDTSRIIAFHTPRLIYSDARYGVDWVLQALPGGIGISTRMETSPFRFRPRGVPPAPNQATEDGNRFADWALAPRFGVFAGYRNIPDAAHTWDAGVSFSYLRPLGRRPAAGLLFQWSVQPICFHLRTGDPSRPIESKTFVAATVGIGWQDDTPLAITREKILDGIQVQEIRIRRWRWRVGFEYGRVPRYPLAEGFGDTWAFAVRHRDRGSGEYTLVYGRTAFNEEFFGVSIGTFLRW